MLGQCPPGRGAVGHAAYQRPTAAPVDELQPHVHTGNISAGCRPLLQEGRAPPHQSAADPNR